MQVITKTNQAIALFRRRPLPEAIFIAGTDTDIGKTFISSILMSGARASYWKPVQCGLEPESDSQTVKRLSECEPALIHREAFKLTAPLSPHIAAAREGVTINLDQFTLPVARHWSRLIVEGAGGVMTPLNCQYLMLDLIKKLNLPVLLVARSGLGTINHTLLTLRALKESAVDVFGVVMNGGKNEDNKSAVEHFSHVPVIAQIEKQTAVCPALLKRLCAEHFGEYL